MRHALKDETLRSLLDRYVIAFLLQVQHTLLANSLATVQTRLARWLLMAQDRLQARVIPLTQDTIAYMLGIRRPGVTEALHRLRDIGVVEIGRGALTITDRNALRMQAGNFYGIPEKEFARLLGAGPRPPMELVADAV
jgi:CRP-like cAMP-binding protein